MLFGLSIRVLRGWPGLCPVVARGFRPEGLLSCPIQPCTAVGGAAQVELVFGGRCQLRSRHPEVRTPNAPIHPGLRHPLLNCWSVCQQCRHPVV